MATQFRLQQHNLRRTQIIEVWVDGKFRAAIYPSEHGIRVVSNYFKEIAFDPGMPPVVPPFMHFVFTDDDAPTQFGELIKKTPPTM